MSREIDEKKKREYLIEIIGSYLKTNIAIMNYYHSVAEDRKGMSSCNKSIKSCEQALVHLRQIKHTELLEYLYSTFIGNNVIAYSISGQIVNSKKLKEWDTEKGFVEFQQEMKEKREKRLAQEKENEETQKSIEQAKKEGKKVEMVWDKDLKKVKPVILEDKPKA